MKSAISQYQGVGHLLLLVGLVLLAPAVRAAGDPIGGTVDVGTAVPTAAAVREGLFPEDFSPGCKELLAAGQKCMGVKPAIRYSLPASAFEVGSAELPQGLRRQLDVFADVLRSKRGTEGKVRIVGHADASGTPQVNDALSLRRAESVVAYLVAKGADANMLSVVGAGAKSLKNPKDPFSGENRRVEIARQN